MMAKEPSSFSRGFTLIELAVVIAIVGFFLGSILMPLATRVELNQTRTTLDLMEQARDALLGHAITNGRLPCPDTDASSDGVENTVIVSTKVTACGVAGTPTYIGTLPWVTLGLAEADSWGTRFTYGVTPAFAFDSLSLSDTGTLTIETRKADTKVSENMATNVPAVIVSHGRNGLGGTDGDGKGRGAPPASSVDETENQDGDTTFASRTRVLDLATGCSDTVAGTAFCEFDDVLVWISPHVLFERMVAAGRLP